ncbi:condensin subunit ScpA [Isoptericola sp. CG 20/1183]|uniref:Segregation and condensation protein A n=1 Tax=Isoptericola halotolerans TaxID=300560 RepID=A0ABX5EBM0_9MICO|nr:MULTISPECIES: ScpA family protein [Isoptericola]PRZ03492.1 condensin subunit ScpA [Isoptericola sp. CG 20/1183]PRZ03779.1 condensin subunit ScpA [Isoptericola halotolerans]
MAASPDPGRTEPPRAGAFTVHLANFDGPFDLLLSLINARKLDVTEVALAEVTDDFMAHIRAADSASREAAGRGEEHPSWDLGVASEFLVVAATLLDLKAARLLPGIAEEDAEDLELLEARDLLFARLLQYRAYKEVSAVLAERLATEGRRVPRSVPMEAHLAAMLPELVWTLDGDRIAALAAKALEPRLPPVIGLSHLHAPAVSVREQAAVVVRLLRRDRVATFRALTAGEERLVVVARFLALLELFRNGQVAFDQVAALGELTVRWTGDDGGEIGEEFEEFEGAVEGAA